MCIRDRGIGKPGLFMDELGDVVKALRVFDLLIGYLDNVIPLIPALAAVAAPAVASAVGGVDAGAAVIIVRAVGVCLLYTSRCV